jgi:hypothetical protein
MRVLLTITNRSYHQRPGNHPQRFRDVLVPPAIS